MAQCGVCGLTAFGRPQAWFTHTNNFVLTTENKLCSNLDIYINKSPKKSAKVFSSYFSLLDIKIIKKNIYYCALGALFSIKV